MLSRLLRDHSAHKADTKRQNGPQLPMSPPHLFFFSLRTSAAGNISVLLRKEAAKATDDFTQCFNQVLSERIAVVFGNQRNLEREAKELTEETKRFMKQTKKWLEMVEGMNTSLKELGDVEHWSRIMESDMGEIADTLELAGR
ncbi:MAG: GCN5-like protein 1-domain-containing protein [Olpidium bornovanus]|uniref:Biogenesis of lysosome-related organelles complex 1 subunit 1 n=1 Tax=Olpidium bornovanus TaxID=278681 RepID=A0A8H8A206_9FUNG|nr:MAG: GCN5-like protein 1-domain-containing protein [Olpidium bornovanus]